MMQRFFIEHFCEPVFDPWLEASLSRGVIGIPGGSPLPVEQFDKFNQPHFSPRRWPWLDPKADAEATKIEIAEGWTSHARVCAEKGCDEEEILDEIELTMNERSRLGLVSKERIDAMRLGKAEEEEATPPLIASIGVGGVQGLVQIVQQIGTGELSEDQASEILVVVFGFTTEQAKRISKPNTKKG
jgi:hypothetical protein